MNVSRVRAEPVVTDTVDHGSVRRALDLARLAPSLHNSQPWWWHLGDGVVHLHADLDRWLPATDPDALGLLISCGTVLHHLRVAPAAEGIGATVHRLPDPDDPDLPAVLGLRPHRASPRWIRGTATSSRTWTVGRAGDAGVPFASIPVAGPHRTGLPLRTFPRADLADPHGDRAGTATGRAGSSRRPLDEQIEYLRPERSLPDEAPRQGPA